MYVNAAVIKPWGLIEVLSSERIVIPLPFLSQTTSSFESVSWLLPIPSHFRLFRWELGLVNYSFINLTCVPFLPCCSPPSRTFITPPLQDDQSSPPGLSPRLCSRSSSTLPPSKSSFWSIQFLGLKILRTSGLVTWLFAMPFRVALSTTS